MKTKLYSFFTLTFSLLIGSQASFAQVNGDFESWETINVGNNLDEWQTTNGELPGIGAVEQIQGDATHGTSSIKFNNLVIEDFGETDTAFGYMINGDFGDNGPSGGIPYTDNADMFAGSFKCNLAPGDSAIAIVMFLKSGFPPSTYGMYTAFATDQVNNWTEFSFPVNPLNYDPDTVFIAIASSRYAITEIPQPNIEDTWIQLDDIHFTKNGVRQTDIPNYSFEDWTPITYTEPEFWNTFNQSLASVSADGNAVQSSDAYSGNYALELNTEEIYFGGNDMDTVPGIATLGDIFFSNAGIPFEYMLDSITGYHQYSYNVSDTAYLIATLSDENQNITGSGSMLFTQQTSGYTHFNIPVFSFGTPDSMNIIIFSGEKPSSSLLMDDIQLWSGNISVGLEEVTTGKLISVYPNPATEYIQFEALQSFNYQITDVSGKMVKSGQSFNNGLTNINVSELPKGNYLLNIIYDNNSYQKAIFSVQ